MKEDNIFFVSITVQSNQYKLLCCHPWGKSPDSFKQIIQFCESFIQDKTLQTLYNFLIMLAFL